MARDSRGVHIRQNEPDTLRRDTAQRVPGDESHQPESLDRLAHRVAHDINNLLAVIISVGTLVADDIDAARRNGCTHLDNVGTDMETVLGAALRGAELTGQLLSFRTPPSHTGTTSWVAGQRDGCPPVRSGGDAHGHVDGQHA